MSVFKLIKTQTDAGVDYVLAAGLAATLQAYQWVRS